MPPESIQSAQPIVSHCRSIPHLSEYNGGGVWTFLLSRANQTCDRPG